MKNFNLLIIILIIFFQTGNVLSNDNIFSVNNIELTKSKNLSNNDMANKAISKGFEILKDKILLERDKVKLSKLIYKDIKDLVSYYQVLETETDKLDNNKIIFNILFDKQKLHSLFYSSGILYSEISNKELFVLPIFKKEEKIYIYNKNYFFENWNKKKINLLDFALLIENIEIIRNIQSKKNNLLDLELEELFKEYPNKNIALIIIEETNSKSEKVFIKTRIVGKKISKTLVIDKTKKKIIENYDKIIFETKKELFNLVKSQNLIDIRTPSFLNAKFVSKKDSKLSDLMKKLDKVDSIENIYVQKFNKRSVFLKIKYLGKLDNILEQLKIYKIDLSLKGEEWSISLI